MDTNMTSLIRVTTVLFLITILPWQFNSIIAYAEPLSNNLFAADLLSVISENKTKQNIVYSPISIYNSLALIYLVAEGRTAEEIRKVLYRDPEEIKPEFAFKLHNFLTKRFRNKDKLANNAPQLLMNYRLFVKHGINVLPPMRFHAESVNFRHYKLVARKINRWVQMQTKNKIINFMSPHAVHKNASVLFVNVIYFKGTWLKPFNPHATKLLNFHVSSNKQVPVDTMLTVADFRYADLPDLNAKALEMSYNNSDISMLILLPNEIDGLAALENTIKGVDLSTIASRMKEERLVVAVPKFRLEFEINLKKPLKKLGCSTMFTRHAKLVGMFQSDSPQEIFDVKHKVLLDVNETGTMTAVSNHSVISHKTVTTIFRADHPFFFAIRSESVVYFAGHIAKFRCNDPPLT